MDVRSRRHILLGILIPWIGIGSVLVGGVSAQDTTPPAAPTNLVATPGDGEVTLDWDDNVEVDLAGYKVLRSTTSGGPYSEIYDGVASTYGDGSVVNGTTYYYVAQAYDNAAIPNVSDNSVEASATPTDQTPPTPVISSSESPGPTNASSIPLSIDFGEAVTGFTSSDVTVVGATKSGFSGGPQVYTLSLAPTGDGTVTADIGAGAAFDGASNPSNAAAGFSIVSDRTAPSVVITSSETSPTGASPIPVTLTFSEAVTGLVLGEVTVGNGTASNLQTTDQRIYTVDVTASSSGAVTVDVGGSVAQDAAGNANTAAAQFSITYDSAPPTPVISSSESPGPTNASSIPLSIDFGEAVTGFTSSDVTVVGATKSGFSGGPQVYTLSLAPTGDGTVTADIGAGAAFDGASNPSNAAAGFSIVSDRTAPSVVITSSETSPTGASPIPVTLTFSEAVTGLVLGEVTVGNGTASNLQTTDQRIYTVDVTASSSGAVTVDVGGSVAQDAAGNANTAAAQFSITYDSAPPTPVISSSESPGPTNASSIPLSIDFGEAVTGFTSSDVTVVGATKSGFSGGPQVYTLSLAPTGDGTVTADIGAGAAFDGASNPSNAAAGFSIVSDRTAPSVVITSSETSPTGASPIPVTLTFSEAVTGLVLGEVTVGNGTASNLQTTDQRIYTVDVTASSSGAVTVDVGGSVAQDAAGNANTAAAQFSITYDSAPPTPVISSSESPGPTNASSIPLSIDFGEAVTGFTSSDVTVVGATKSGFSGGPQVYTLSLAPTGDGTVTADIGAGAAFDGASNPSNAAAGFSIVSDRTAPSVVITSSETSPTGASPIPVTLTFSEAVTGLVLGEVTVGNGTASNLQTTDQRIYTVDVTASSSGAVTVDVGGSVAQDAAGNANTAAAQFSITYDSAPPTPVISSSESPGPTNASSIPLSIDFGEAVTGFTSSDVTVVGATKSGFSGGPQVYTLSLAPTGDGTVTADIGAGAAFDVASNPSNAAAGFSIVSDRTAPSVVITSSETSPTGASPIPVTLTFSEAVTGLVLGEVTVGNGTASNLQTTDQRIYTVDVTASSSGAVTVDVGGSVAQDAAGNANTAAAQFSITYDSAPPTPVISSSESPGPTNASSIPLSIDFGEAVTGFTSSDVTVVGATKSGFSGGPQVYTLSLAPTGDGTVTADIGAGAAFDGASNPSNAAAGFSIVSDRTAPSPAISSTAGDPTATSPIPVSIDFGEPVTGFVSADLVVSNGSAGLVTGGPRFYSVDITPLVQGVVTVDIPASAATDVAGNTSTAAAQFGITYDFNDPPTVANPIPDQVAAEDVLFSFVFAANAFADADDDPLTFIADLSDGSPLPSWLDFNGATRTFVGTPTNDDVGILSVRVTASDPLAASVSDIFLLTVQNTNDAPALVNPIPDQAATQGQPFLFAFAANTFNDVDGDELTYSALRHNDQPLPAWLTFDPGTRTFSGTPGNGDVGKLQVRVTAEDPSLAAASDVFDIDVADVNDPPAFTSTPVTGATQGSPYSYAITASDVDGDALTISAASPLPSWLSLIDNGDGTASLTGTPANDDVGPNDVDLQVSDGSLTDEQFFTVNVVNINDPPFFTSSPITAATQDALYTYAITTDDPDSDPVSISPATPLPGWLTLVDNGNGTGSLSGTPTNDDTGNHVVDLQADDGLLSSAQSFTITVANVNDPPSFTSSPVSGATQGSPYVYNIATSDPDGDGLTITAATPLPVWLSLSDNGDGTATLSGTPGNDDVGPNNVDLQVTDGALTDGQSFTVTVANINDPPSFTSAPVSIATEDVLYSYALSATDPDGDPVAFSATSPLPDWLTLTDNNDGTAILFGTPLNEDVGPNSVELRVTDGSLSDLQAFAIVVSNTNDPPVFTSAAIPGATQDVLYSYLVTATDPDGDALFFATGSPLPTWLTLTDNGDGTAALSGTPGNSDVGPHFVDLQVSDGAEIDTQSFTITVANVNDPPVFTSTPLTVATEDQLYSYSITTSDPDVGESLTLLASTRPAWLALTDNGDGTGTLSGTPDNSQVGTHNVTLEVLDGDVSTPQSFVVTVSNTNDAPAFSSTPVTAATEDAPYTYNIAGLDPDVSDVLTFSAPTKPTWLSFVDNGNRTAQLTGTPSNAEVGPHSVVLELSDGTVSVLQSFTITVANTNDGPVFTSTPATAATEDALYSYSITTLDVDIGAVLTITAPTKPSWLSLTVTGNGTATLAGTPANAEVGPHPVTLEVTDGLVASQQSFTVTVSNTNDAPVIVSPPVTGATQDVAYTYPIVATDPDVGDALTFTDVAIPSWATLTDNTDGTATLAGTPRNADVGPHAVEIRVDDQAGAFDTQTFSIDVRNTNDPPAAVDDAYTVDESGTLMTNESGAPPLGVLFNDSDPDGDALTAFLVAAPVNGSLSINLDGTFTYVHDGSETTSDSFTYFATDGAFVSNTATASIAITPINDTPAFASSPVISATQGVLYSYNISATDADDAALAITAPTKPDWLSLNDNGDGTAILSGIPDNADVGPHPVTLEVSDGSVSVQQSFTVVVSNTNDPPSITSSPVTSGTQDAVYTYDLIASDPDGNALTYSAPVLPGWLSLSDNGDGTARLTGTPSNDDVGANAVTIRVSDGSLFDEQSFSISVANVNDPPAFTSPPVTTATQDLPYSYSVTTIDPDDDTRTIVADARPDWLTLTDNSDGTATLSGTPGNTDVGVHAVTLTVSDGTLSDQQSFTVTVSNVNEAPVITSLPDTVATEDVLYTYAVTASDPDVGTTLSFSAVTLPSWLALFDNEDGTATLTGTPLNEHVGPNSVVLRVSDGALTDDQSFSIIVANTNDAPIFVSSPVTTASQDVAYLYAIEVADPDGDTIDLTATTLPAWLSLTYEGGGSATLTGTPTNSHIGTHNVSLSATDGTVSTSQSFTITVSDRNDPPSFTSSPATAATEDQPYTYTVTATDPDAGTTIAFSAPTLPGWLTLSDNGDGTADLTGIPSNENVGANPVVLRVSDGSLTDEQSFTVNVTNTNDAPAFTSSPVTTVAEDAVYSYEVTAVDPDGDSISLTAETLPTWLSFTDNGDGTGLLSGTPLNRHVGIHPVSLVVADGSDSAAQGFSVTVTNTNDAPIVTSVPETDATEDVEYRYDVAASDADAGSTLAFTGQTIPDWIAFTDNGDGTALLQGTPSNEDVGDHPVLILVSDGIAATPQSFTVRVANTNDPPEFVSPPVTGALQDQPYSYAILAADPDIGDVLMLSAEVIPDWLTLSDNGDGSGTLTGTPSNTYVGDNPVELRVSDGPGAFDTQVFVVRVRNTNDAPTAAPDVYTVLEGGSLAASAGGDPPGVLDNDVDPDGDALSATLTSGVSNGSLQFDVDGSFAYQHDGSETTEDGFQYIANDGIFVSNTAAVQIQIIPVNDPPAFTSSPVRSASQDVEYSYLVTTADPDGPSVSLSASTIPDWLTFVDNTDGTGLLAGTPQNVDVGIHAVVVVASDGENSVEQSFSIDVGNTNDPPVYTSTPDVDAMQDELYRYDVAAIDPDGDAVLFTLTTGPGWLGLADNGDGTAVLSGTPSAADVGVHPVSITVSDGVETADQSFSVTVDDVNDPPQFVSDPITEAVQEIAYEYRIQTQDPDGDAITISASPIAGWLDLTDNEDGTAVLSGTPTPEDLGDHEIVLVASDGTESTEQRFMIAVDNGNAKPVARDDEYPLDEGGRLQGVAGRVPSGILDNDTDEDGQALSAVLVTDVSHGTLTLEADGSFTYEHDGSETLADQFTYRATDGIDESAEATVAFTIISVNDAPIAVDDVFSTPEDTPARLALTRNDSDAEGDPIRINSVTAPAHGSVAIQQDTIAVYTPSADFSGTDSFKYTVSDDQDAISDTAVVRITIDSVNDAPVAADDFATTGEAAPVVIRVLDNDVDPDGDPLTISKVGEPVHGAAEAGGVTGTIAYTPEPGFLGEDEFSYTISDGSGGEGSGTVRVTVTSLRFSILETGTLGGPASRAFAINDEGAVAGTSLSESGVVKGFLWSGDVIIDLESEGSRSSQAFGVNDFGYVVGAVEQDGQISAALWQLGADKVESTVLPGLDGGFSVAFGINNAGEMVGTSLGSGTFRPVLWSEGSLIELFVDGVSAGQAEAINEDGQLAGLTIGPSAVESAMLGTRDNLVRIGTESTRAYAVNGLGDAVGSKQSSGTVSAVRWNADGTEAVLETSGSAFSEAYGINDSGWIVGAFAPPASAAKPLSASLRSNDLLFEMKPDGSTGFRFSGSMDDTHDAGKSSGVDLRASLWIGGSLIDLNALIPSDAGWTLVEARDVNNRGQIAGYGMYEGQPRAFVLALTGNEAPKAADDHVVAFSDEAVLVHVLVNDVDVDGDTLQVISYGAAARGNVELLGHGSLVYTPEPGFVGEDQFPYTVSDGKGGSDRATVILSVAETPERFVLNQNYPNPFNPTTTISYTLPVEAHVRLAVYDALGRTVGMLVNQEQGRGHYEVTFDGRGLSSGVYVYRLVAGEFVSLRQLVLLK